ncbi:hypothetical protein [Burkholderia cenocepacia]|uniref:hypothetical protein n=1 Tax=Burkholderia cenocepacia TaxID=95486 RepID=UPI001CF35AC4|nr:hypothetical protein [Burkholderia cenocepacia]MCA8086600.1 hypothetical protein [Burkholderia cenocepacia]
MNILKIGAAALATATAFALPAGASAQSRGKVLVVMSSAHTLDLRDGRKYSTGYYLNEFVVPYRKLVEAGYEPVIANPNGDMPVMDANSNNKLFFGGDDAARAEALKYAQGIAQLKHPKTLASVVSEGTGGYVGLFIPGGHAPMVCSRTGISARSWSASTTAGALPGSSVTGRSCCCPRCATRMPSLHRWPPTTATRMPSRLAGRMPVTG